VTIRTISGALVVAAIGVPVLDTWKAVLLGVLLLALVFATRKPGSWRLVAAAGVVIGVIAVKAFLPRADIAEAHNAFLVIHDGEALERGLPPEIFQSWKAQFDALYPPDTEPYSERSLWRPAGVPGSLYTQSSDGIWRTPKYTRQVDSIGFHTLGEFRGGFANEIQYNFWSGELRREQMPFYVMYELTPASVGSGLTWRGQVFWERPGGFDEIVHSQVAARSIAPDDVGKRVYAVFFPKRDALLDFSMEPSLTLRLGRWIGSFLSLGGALAVVMLTVRPRWPSYLRALAIFSGGYLFMTAFLAVSAGKYLGKTYPPQGGGDDGLVHDGWGRLMAMLAGRGHVVAALEGTEPVYWFTPGTRYVRMVEKLMFGDTNLLFALILPCVLIVIFYLARHFLGTRWAWVVTAIVCVLPVENISYLQYIANAKLGYGEAIGGGLFLLGLALMLRTQPAWGGTDRSLTLAWVAGAALAGSMFIRPNFAIAVAWLGAAYALASWKQKDVAMMVALAAGLVLALWMPLHNWYYGGEFHLISKSGATVSVSLGVRDYVAALADLVRGRLHTGATALTSKQIEGWLLAEGFIMLPQLKPFAWAAHAVKLLALIVTMSVAARWVAGGLTRGADLGVVAVASLCAHLPMLFLFTTNYRYAMLGWDLSIVVLIVWLFRMRSASTVPRVEVSPI
jgi:hypothetical protein